MEIVAGIYFFAIGILWFVGVVRPRTATARDGRVAFQSRGVVVQGTAYFAFGSAFLASALGLPGAVSLSIAILAAIIAVVGAKLDRNDRRRGTDGNT